MDKIPGQRNQSGNLTPQNPATRESVKHLLSVVCLTHRAEQTRELEEIYWLGLSDLTLQQISDLALLVVRETRFWPSPGQLRKLIGIPDTEERLRLAKEAESTEALSALTRILDNLKITRVYCNNEARDMWVKGVPEKGCLPISMEPAETLVPVLTRFGSGSLDGAVELLIQHPRFRSMDAEMSGLGFDLSAIDKLEKRWLAAWKESA